MKYAFRKGSGYYKLKRIRQIKVKGLTQDPKDTDLQDSASVGLLFSRQGSVKEAPP